MKEKLEVIDLSIKIIRELVVTALIAVAFVWIVANYNINLSELNIFGAKASLVAKANSSDSKQGDADSVATGDQSEAAFAITTEEAGWVYVGTYKDGSYIGDSYFNVREFPLPKDIVLTANVDINKRASKPFKNDEGQWWKGKVIGLVTAGQKVKVLETATDIPAKGGGYRVWIKVQPIQNS